MYIYVSDEQNLLVFHEKTDEWYRMRSLEIDKDTYGNLDYDQGGILIGR